jgi:hypothetical protein
LLDLFSLREGFTEAELRHLIVSQRSEADPFPATIIDQLLSFRQMVELLKKQYVYH